MSVRRLKRQVKKTIPKKWLLPLTFHYKMLKRKLEPELIYFDQIFSVRKTTAIDIGAYVGWYTYRLSRLYKRVIAFEPQRDCVDIINAAELHNLETHVIGLSNQEGYMNLNIPYTAEGWIEQGDASFNEFKQKFETIRVPVKRLDDFRFTDVGFIKIDVEGHEDKVLDGAARTIAKEKPDMLIEIEQRHLQSPIEDIFRKVTDMGYEGFFYSSNRLQNLSTFSHEVHQKQHNLKSKNYINNFIFIPR